MLLHAQLKILKLSVIIFILRFFFVSNCFRISLNGSESRNSVEGLTYKITGLKGGMPPSWIRYWKRAGVKKMKPTKISTLSIENETLNVFAWAWLKGVTWYKKYNAFWMFLCCVATALFCFVNNRGIQTGSICVFPKVIWDWIQATISPVFVLNLHIIYLLTSCTWVHTW